jgi:pilus assembly protein Flp/PilA
MISKFLSNEDGATAIEYGLIAAMISVGIILALTTLRGELQGTFSDISDAMTDRR